MKSCKRCRARAGCVSLCKEVEALLPKEDTGRDAHREVRLSPEVYEALMERVSYAEWHHQEVINKYPSVDLSKLTAKERRALVLLADGLSQREAARRLGIRLSSLQKRVRTARARLSGGRTEQVVEGEETGGRIGRGGRP